MKVVIEIPEGLKEDFIQETWTALSCVEMKEALMNGTILPKGHGDLVYRKDVINTIRELAEYHAKYYTGDSITPNRIIANIWQLPTIIEDDEESD